MSRAMDQPTPPSAPPSDGVHRGKACFACIRAKRRCDKKLPTCQRCMDREEICQYSTVRPYRRRKVRLPGPVLFDDPFTALATTSSSDDVGSSSSDALPSVAIGGDEYMFPLQDQCDNTDSSIDLARPPSNAPWFLQGDTWSIFHEGDCKTNAIVDVSCLKDFARWIRRWLWQWVAESHCPFIHRELYREIGMPPCLQDAYATLAAYTAKNENNEEVLSQIIETRVNILLKQNHESPSMHLDSPSTTMMSLTTMEHLARVQSLIVYQFIRLFDGDIRQRANAEKDLQIQEVWMSQLWESAKLSASLQTAFGGSDFLGGRPRFDNHSSDRRWRDWILAESVRRTWMVAKYVQSIYTVLRDGEVLCPGSIPWTMRTGLWDTKCGTTWCHMVENTDPIFMRPEPQHRVFAIAQATDIDVFGLTIFSIMRDTYSLNKWVAQSSTLDLKGILDK